MAKKTTVHYKSPPTEPGAPRPATPAQAMQGNPWERLERALAYAPSSGTWGWVTSALEAIDDPDAVRAMIQRASARLDAWPEALREAPTPWVAAALNGDPGALARLDACASFDIDFDDGIAFTLETWDALMALDAMQRLSPDRRLWEALRAASTLGVEHGYEVLHAPFSPPKQTRYKQIESLSLGLGRALSAAGMRDAQDCLDHAMIHRAEVCGEGVSLIEFGLARQLYWVDEPPQAALVDRMESMVRACLWNPKVLTVVESSRRAGRGHYINVLIWVTEGEALCIVQHYDPL